MTGRLATLNWVVIAAYFLVTFKVAIWTTRRYPLMNITAAGAVPM